MKFLLSILLLSFVSFIYYLIGAFVSWDLTWILNIGKLYGIERFLYGLWYLFFAIPAFMMPLQK